MTQPVRGLVARGLERGETKENQGGDVSSDDASLFRLEASKIFEEKPANARINLVRP
jgi:hypothetical protein